MNNAQMLAKQVYASGEFAELPEDQLYTHVGDSLFTYLMIELGEDEDCADIPTAIRRVHTSIEELETVLAALEAAE